LELLTKEPNLQNIALQNYVLFILQHFSDSMMK
jgi:hypothetical protein